MTNYRREISLKNADVETKLKEAVSNNNTSYLRKKFMFRKRLVNCYMSDGKTLLIYAVTNNPNCLKMVKFLLSYHADVNRVDVYMKSPLHHVIRDFDYTNADISLKVIEKLLKRGADISLQDLDGDTCLHIAAGLNEGDIPLQMLLRHCDDNVRNIKNKRGETPCAIAAREGKISQVFLLLTKEGRPCDFNTILYRAIDTGCLDVVKIVNFHYNRAVPSAESSIYDPKRMFLEQGNPLLYALCYDIHDEELLRYLLCAMVENIDKRDRSGNSALHYAVMKDLPGFAITLLEKGASINANSHKRNTPLHYAAYSENFDMITLLCFRGTKVTKILKQKNNCNETVLGIACKLKNRNLLKLLLRILKIKDMLLGNKDFETLLPQICQILFGEETVKTNADDHTLFVDSKYIYCNQHGLYNSICIECFITSEACLNERNEQGQTLLHEAVSKELFVFAEELIKEGADMNIKDAEGNTILHILAENNSHQLLEIAVLHGANVNLQNQHGKTPLHITCENRSQTSTDKLLKAAFKSNDVECGKTNQDVGLDELSCAVSTFGLTDRDGNTPLHVAIQNHDFTKHSRQSITVLIRCIPDINIQNNDGETPLIVAVKLGRSDIVSILVKHNVDVTICDNIGSNSFDYALAHKFDKIFLTLMSSSVNFNELNSNGDSLLHLAVKRNYHQIIDHIFTNVNTLDVNAQNKNGDTPLHLCFEVGQTKTDIVQKLVDRGAINNLRNVDQRSPLDLAMEYGAHDVMRLFYDRSDDANVMGNFECPVCLELPKQIFQCKNGHVVCSECKSKPNMENCPLCRVTMTSCIRNKRLEKEMLKTLYVHLNNKNG